VSAVCLLVFAFTWGGNKYAWDSGMIIGCFVGAGILSIIFCFIEVYVAKEPNIPPELFKYKIYNIVLLAQLGLGASMFGPMFYMPEYFELVLGNSATLAGLRGLPMTAGMVLASVMAGQIIARTGNYANFPRFGSWILPLACALLATITDTTHLGLIYFYEFLIGVGMGTVMQSSLLAIQSQLPKKYNGTANGTIMFLRMMFGTVMLSVYQNVMSKGLDGTNVYFATPAQIAKALDGVFWAVFASACFGMVFSWFIVQAAPDPTQDVEVHGPSPMTEM